jgi:hypothetical protein
MILWTVDTPKCIYICRFNLYFCLVERVYEQEAMFTIPEINLALSSYFATMAPDEYYRAEMNGIVTL